MNNDLFNVCEIQLSYTPNYNPQERPQIHSSKAVYELLLNNWDMSLINYIEQAKLVLLNRNNRVIGLVDLSKGGGGSTVLDIKVILAIALKSTASSIIVAHNHPSGNLKPSSEDIRITEKLRDASKIMDIILHDHIIVTQYGYLSLSEENYF